MEDHSHSIAERIVATKDALEVRRVFGDAYESNGVTVIPVAAVRGMSGGGEGGGPSGEDGTGWGDGMGYMLSARPLGVFVLRDGQVSWRPAVDMVRIVIASEAAAIVGLLVLRRVIGSRRNRR